MGSTGTEKQQSHPERVGQPVRSVGLEEAHKAILVPEERKGKLRKNRILVE